MRDGYAKILLVAAAALAVVVTTAMSAYAQDQEPVNGIRFGAFSIHPDLYTALRYNDNVWFEPNNYRPANPRSIPQSIESDFVFNVTPSINFNIDASTFHMSASYRFYNDTYLGFDDPNHQHHLLDGSNHTVGGVIDYTAPFGLMVGGSDTFEKFEMYEQTGQFIDYVRGEQSHNDGRGWLGFKTGPYESIYFNAMYTNLIDKYEFFPGYNKTTQYLDGEFRLKFFPLTAFVMQGGYNFVTHETFHAADSRAWYADAGIQGAITSMFLLTLKGGYTQADFVTPPGYKTYLATCELTFLFPGQAKLLLGYHHILLPGVDTNYVETQQGVLDFSKTWFSKLSTELVVTYNYNNYSDPVPRLENLILGTFDLTYRIVYWLYGGLGYELDYQILDRLGLKTTAVRNMPNIHLEAKF